VGAVAISDGGGALFCLIGATFGAFSNRKKKHSLSEDKGSTNKWHRSCRGEDKARWDTIGELGQLTAAAEEDWGRDKRGITTTGGASCQKKEHLLQERNLLGSGKKKENRIGVIY